MSKLPKDENNRSISNNEMLKISKRHSKKSVDISENKVHSNNKINIKKILIEEPNKSEQDPITNSSNLGESESKTKSEDNYLEFSNTNSKPIDIYELSIFDGDNLIYNKNFNNTNDRAVINSNNIIQLIKSIDTFTENQLQTSISDITFESQKLIHRKHKDFTGLFLIVLDDHIYYGENTLVAKVFDDLFQWIKEVILEADSVREFTKNLDQFLDQIISTYIDIFKENYKDYSFQINKSWRISRTIICDQSGVPLLTRIHDDVVIDQDPVLITSFLYAINIFSNNNIMKDISLINVGRFKIFINTVNEYMYCIIADFGEDIPISLNSELYTVHLDLLSSMSQTIQLLSVDLSTIPTSTLEGIIDNFVEESLLNLHHEYLH